MRLIDGDALIEAIDKLPTTPHWHDMHKEAVIWEILNAPTVATDTNVLCKWISMKDRKPDTDGKYLCLWQGKSIECGMFINGHFRLYGEIKDNLVTHWMPLPKMPEEEKDA